MNSKETPKGFSCLIRLRLLLALMIVFSSKPLGAEIQVSDEQVRGAMSIMRYWYYENVAEDLEAAKAQCNIWETQMAFKVEQKNLKLLFKKGCAEIEPGKMLGSVYFTNQLSLFSF